MDKYGLRDARCKALLICVKYEINCFILDAKSPCIKQCEYGKTLFPVFQCHPCGFQNISEL